MTDHQIYIARDRSRLHLRRSAIAPDTLFLSTADSDVIASISIPTAELLAMIDTAAPDAMRAYLRETAPVFVADVLRPAGAAAEHFDYLEPEELDAIPEADSPEDVDEHPDRDDPTERAQLDRAWALELAHRLFPHAGSLLAMKVAAWIIDGQQR